MERKTRRLFLFCVVALFVSTVPACQKVAIPVLHDGLKVTRYTRYTLRGKPKKDRVRVYRTNFLGQGVVAKPGSEVNITLFSKSRIDMTIDGQIYSMYYKDQAFPTNKEGIDRFLDKYFANSPRDLRMSRLDDSVKTYIENGEAAISMTKEEVLMALGYPRRINEKIPAGALDRSRILESSQWTYQVNGFRRRTYQFDTDGKLINVIQ